MGAPLTGGASISRAPLLLNRFVLGGRTAAPLGSLRHAAAGRRAGEPYITDHLSGIDF